MVVRSVAALVLALGGLVLVPASSAPAGAPAGARAAASRPAAYVPPIKHVFVINIENKGYDTTWGDDSAAPYLAKTLRAKGVLLDRYYATAHNSQPNYVAQVSGQGPNPQMQADCQVFTDFARTSTVDPNQAVGSGCVFPDDVPTLPGQLSDAGRTWKGYMDDMEEPCQHPEVGAIDPTQKATAKKNYAVRHNPFMYFHSIIDRAGYCKKHVVALTRLKRDLRHVGTTPNLAYITPDLCHDGHDAPCADGRPGGLATIDSWMRRWVPLILRSPAFRRNGLLVVTADESDGPQADSDACCGPVTSANSPLPGIVGPGGGRIGALLVSRWIRPGTWSTTPYNHYSLLGSVEEVFGLPKLGYARDEGVDTFGLDVYNRYSPS
ncbi:alkaline phosphatase family protein [Nocardioides mangrovi]|uniref:Alkaline phosphatase family protein n=1 Tax=Nocardioides mangrovi TaxID=2874580 RepID=A0ABS7U8J4_9ACTN|nr:alkaline phosphatase family protein [Nocardioides mangrovi]MBZ5736977.1 alkaline phosphatase family protein [Nocardioides mangrovi]